MQNVSEKATEWMEDLLSVQGGVFVFGKVCLVIMIFAAFDVGITIRDARGNRPEALTLPSEEAPSPEKQRKDLETYAIITNRNIFGAEPEEQGGPAEAPITTLKLRLVGTYIQKGRAPFAIVEDTAKKEQGVFEKGQSIFNQAKLEDVFAESVRISYNNKVETLVMEEGSASGGSGRGTAKAGDSITSSEDGTEFAVSETELNNAMANLPRLLSQARAVPYFKNGQSIGMRLFAIRKGSLYEKLGLKNGDIIKSVNDNSLTDPSQALKIFEELKSERSISVVLERKGAERSMNYEIE